MRTKPKTVGPDGSFEQLLDSSKTGDMILLANLRDLSPSFTIHRSWSVGKGGLIFVKDGQLILRDDVLRGLLRDFDDEDWRAAGDGIILLKEDGLHYVSDQGDRILGQAGDGGWEPCLSGVMTTSSSKIVEYGFDGTKKIHFIPTGTEGQNGEWHPHHKGGVLVDIGSDYYKIVHVTSNGERKVIFDEEMDGIVGPGGWFSHPAGVVLRVKSKLFLNGKPYLDEIQTEACYSTPDLPGFVIEDRNGNILLVVHKD